MCQVKSHRASVVAIIPALISRCVGESPGPSGCKASMKCRKMRWVESKAQKKPHERGEMMRIWGLIIFNTLRLAGLFDTLKNWLIRQATADVRVQAILLAWALLALLPPWILIYLVTGWKGFREGWPLALVGSLAYIAGQLPVSQFLGPYLPDVAGALVCFAVLLVLLKVWQPKTVLGYGGEVLSAEEQQARMTASIGESSERHSI